MAINITTKKQESSRSRRWYQAGFLLKTNHRKLQVIGFGSVWASTLLFGAITSLMALIPAPTAYADTDPTNFYWLNNQTIKGQEDHSNWLDVNVTDRTRTYVRQNQKLKCNNELRTQTGYHSKTDFIDVDEWDDVKGTGKGTLYWFTEGTTAGSAACKGHQKPITIGSVDPEFFITYVWIDSNTIRHSFTSDVGKMGAGEDNTNTWETDDFLLSTTPPNTGLYMAQKGGDCRDYITNISSDKKTAQIIDNQIVGGDCAPANKYTLNLGFPDNAKIDSDAKDGAPGGSKGSAAPEKSCESKNSDGSLGWVICGVLRILDAAITWIDDQIQDLLVIKMSYFNDKSFVQGWGTIRNIALLILVPIMLIMVIATALEIGPFDAYTVKKALPRFLVAVLFIVLSLPLLKFLVQLSNVVETGILGLITSAFGTDAQNITLKSLFNPDTSDTVIGGAGVFITLAAGAYAFMTGAVTVGIIGSFALVAFIGLLIGYVVLLIRVLLVVALVLVAPLAILPWIFPGNDKLWNIWKNTITTLLLLGPVLGALIGAGRILAKITPDEQWYFKIFFYIVVYFLILTTIKSFGGLAGTILNWGNGKARGFFDNQRKRRQEAQQRAKTDAQMGNRFKFGPMRRLNHASQNMAILPTAAKNAGYNPSRLSANMRTARGTSEYEHSSEFLEKNQNMRAIMGDDDKMWAMMKGGNADQIRASLESVSPGRFKGEKNRQSREDAVAQILQAQREGGMAVTKLAATRAQFSTGTGFDNSGQMLDSINDVAGSDRTLANRLLAQARSDAVKSGRIDLGGGGFGPTSGAMEKLWRAKQGDPELANYTQESAEHEVMESVIDSNGGASAIYGKPKSAKKVAEAYVRRLERIKNDIATGQVDPKAGQRELDQTLASVMGLYDAMGQTSPGNAREVANVLMGATMTDPGNGQQTTWLNLANMRSVSADFSQMRRDYSSAAAAQAAREGVAPSPSPNIGGGPPTPPIPGAPGS